jgi:hypothetical protein
VVGGTEVLMGAGNDILAAIKALSEQIAELRSIVVASLPVEVPEVDIDDKYGDPDVRKDPPRWKGTPQAPRKMSLCPPEYLEVLAELRLWQAKQEQKKGTAESEKKAGYNRLDAARAMAWAARKRANGETQGDDL